MGQNAVRLAPLITSVGVQGDALSAIAAFWPWLVDKRVIE